MDKENKTTEHSVAHTYAEDMAKVITDNKDGLVKKIIHGEEEHEIEKENISPETKMNQRFMLIGLLLILFALIIFLFFMFFTKEIATIPIQKQFTPLVFNDKTTFIEVKDLTKDALEQSIVNEVNSTEVKRGGLEGIYLTLNKKAVGLRQFLTLIKSNFVPPSSVFLYEEYLLGVVNENSLPDSPTPASLSGKDFFVLLKVRTLPDVFESLRAWENKMFLDLHTIFGVVLTADTKYLLTKDFADGLIENKNARILYDSNNKIVMMYVFADDNTVIITNTESVAHEIMARLASSRLKK